MRMSAGNILTDADADADYIACLKICIIQLRETIFSHISLTYVLPGYGTWTQVVMHPTNHFPQPPPFGKWQNYIGMVT